MKIWMEETMNLFREIFADIRLVYDEASRNWKEKTFFWTMAVLVVALSLWIPGVMYYAVIIGLLVGEVQKRVAVRQWDEMYGKKKQGV